MRDARGAVCRQSSQGGRQEVFAVGVPGGGRLAHVCNRTRGSTTHFRTMTSRFTRVCRRSATRFFATPKEARVVKGRASRGNNHIVTNDVSVSAVNTTCPGGDDIVHVADRKCSGRIIMSVGSLTDMPGTRKAMSLMTNVIRTVRGFNFGMTNFSTCIAAGMVHTTNMDSSTSFRVLMYSVVGCFFGSNTVACVGCTGTKRCTRGIC